MPQILIRPAHQNLDPDTLRRTQVRVSSPKVCSVDRDFDQRDAVRGVRRQARLSLIGAVPAKERRRGMCHTSRQDNGQDTQGQKSGNSCDDKSASLKCPEPERIRPADVD